MNETLDESMDLTLDLDEEEQVGVVNDVEKEYEDATEKEIESEEKWNMENNSINLTFEY